MSEKEVQPVIAVRIPPDLYVWAAAQAAAEGISRSAITRRALIRERRRAEAEGGVDG
jgi:hypothetical protein